MPSPNFTVNGASCPPEAALSYGAAVTLALLSTSGVRTVAWSVVGTDSPTTVIPTITPAGSPSGATATATMPSDPSTGLGLSLRVQCVVNGGRDSAGQVDPSLTKTALIGVANSAGIVPLATGESLERHATNGWTAVVNKALVATAGLPGPPGSLTADFVLTSNDSLSGLAVRDGVTPTAGMIALAVGQTTASQNGRYTVAAGAWVYMFANDPAVAAAIGVPVFIKSGVTGAGTNWQLTSGSTLAASKVYKRTTSAGIPAPSLVATSDIALTGVVTVDGVASNAVTGDILCTAQATTANNGYWTPNASGAWVRPSYYGTDSSVAALLGQVSGSVASGSLGVLSTWVQTSGLTLAGSKAFSRYFGVVDKATHDRIVSTTFTAPPPTGDPTIDTPALAAICAKAVATPHSRIRLNTSTAFDYHTNRPLVLDSATAVTFEGSGGGTFAVNSGRIVREGVSVYTTLTANFTQPAIGASVVAQVASTTAFASFPVGDYLEISLWDPSPSPPTVVTATYLITAQDPVGFTLTLTHRFSAFSLGTTVGSTVPLGAQCKTHDSIIQAHSTRGCHWERVSLVAKDPQFIGSAVFGDGRILGPDNQHNGIRKANVQTQNIVAFTPTLRASGPTPPADTLTGTTAVCMRFRVEYTAATTLRYTTNFNEYGGTDWEVSGYSTASGAFPVRINGQPTGLTYTPVNGAHDTKNAYIASIGINIATWNGYNNTVEDLDVAYLFDGVQMYGVGNVAKNITSLQLANALVIGTGSGLEIYVGPEPGTIPYGRGGVRLFNCNGVKGTINAGDAFTTGPIVTIDGGSGYDIDGTYSISNAVSGTAPGCPIRINGMVSGAFGGDFTQSGGAIDAHGPSTSLVCQMKKGLGLPNGGAANLLFGAFLAQFDCEAYSNQSAFETNTRITNPLLLGLPKVAVGMRRTATNTNLANGNNVDLSLNSDHVFLVANSAAAAICGINGGNLGDGFLATLYWSQGHPITLKHQSSTETIPSYRLVTPNGRDMQFGSTPGSAVVLKTTGGWYVLWSTPAAPSIRIVSGTTDAPVGVDAGGLVKCTSGSATTVTMNQNIFAAGEVVELLAFGAGQITVAAGTGCTMATSRSLTSRAQGSVLYVTCLDNTAGASVFQLSGDMT